MRSGQNKKHQNLNVPTHQLATGVGVLRKRRLGTTGCGCHVQYLRVDARPNPGAETESSPGSHTGQSPLSLLILTRLLLMSPEISQ